MKLKLQKNLLVFKLSQAEKKCLCKSGQSLFENIIFPHSQDLIYKLKLTADDNENFCYHNNKIQLSVPYKKFALLELPSKEGISFKFDSFVVTVLVDLFAKEKINYDESR